MEKVGIVVPCFNENNAIIRFIDELEKVLGGLHYEFHLIIVDDASTDDTVQLLIQKQFESRNIHFRLIRLKYNQGHQGAIYQGLRFAKEMDCQKVIVMDGDGEDDPAGIPELLKHDDAEIVHVKRGKRSEGFLFRFLYRIYKLSFLLVTGKVLEFGNYCLINRRVLETAVSRSFISFPAFLLKTKALKKSITLNRRKRLDGKSKMSINGLIYHGFRSYSEFAEEFILFMLKLAIVLADLFLVSIGYIVYEKLFTDRAILGWASTLSAAFFNSALISFGFFFTGIVLLNLYHKSERDKQDHFEIIR